MDTHPKELLQKTDVPVGERGKWRIERFTVSQQDSDFDRLRSMFSSGSRGRYVRPGTYTRLMRGGTLVMSDTSDEMRDHYAPVIHASGHCLINGLGLGLVTEACLRKPEVSSVTVVEVSAEVIDMVAPHLKAKWGDKFAIVHADAITHKEPKGSRFGMVWHDIWDNICSDNLESMGTLHRRYGRRSDWQGSWAKELCLSYR